MSKIQNFAALMVAAGIALSAPHAKAQDASTKTGCETVDPVSRKILQGPFAFIKGTKPVSCDDWGIKVTYEGVVTPETRGTPEISDALPKAMSSLPDGTTLKIGTMWRLSQTNTPVIDGRWHEVIVNNGQQEIQFLNGQYQVVKFVGIEKDESSVGFITHHEIIDSSGKELASVSCVTRNPPITERLSLTMSITCVRSKPFITDPAKVIAFDKAATSELQLYVQFLNASGGIKATEDVPGRKQSFVNDQARSFQGIIAIGHP